MPRKKKVAPKREGKREVPLAAAPRPVPIGAHVVTSFGGWVAVLGHVLLAGSSIAVWEVVMNSELIAPIVFSGQLATTTGTVFSEQHFSRRQLFTNVGRGAAMSPFTVPTVEVHFAFKVGGVDYEGFSFTPIGKDIPSTVTVEYVVTQPAVARIQGFRFFFYDWTVVWILLFPLIALALIVVRCSYASEQIELLRTGAITYGSCVSKRSNNGLDGDGLVVLVYEYELPLPMTGSDAAVKLPAGGATACKVTKGKASMGGGAQSRAKPASSTAYQPLTYRIEHIDFDTSSVEDEIWEPILYLPRDPSVATLLDGLIVKPTAEGYWASPANWWNYLLGPVIVVSINAWYAHRSPLFNFAVLGR